tara:strand:- start:5285 stop:5497 length:213 start_codon:yes stop_codon:yes gene_type:complete
MEEYLVEEDEYHLGVINTSNVVWIYLSNLIGSDTSQRISSNHFDLDNQRSISFYRIDLGNLQSTITHCSN